MAEIRDEDRALSAAQNGEQKKLIAEFAPKAEKYDQIVEILNASNTVNSATIVGVDLEASNVVAVPSEEVLEKIRNIVEPSKKL